jgi:hypothetical protein
MSKNGLGGFFSTLPLNKERQSEVCFSKNNIRHFLKPQIYDCRYSPLFLYLKNKKGKYKQN